MRTVSGLIHLVCRVTLAGFSEETTEARTIARHSIFGGGAMNPYVRRNHLTKFPGLSAERGRRT
jgi:hypothetical protein